METLETLDEDLMTGCISEAEYEDGIRALRIVAYKTALRSHDWTHEWADSMDAVRWGRAALQRLREQRAELDAYGIVWNSIAPLAHRVSA